MDMIEEGDVYCAKRCGRMCKRADYDAAVHDCDGLVRRLGDGWKSHVWDNLGWHFSAVKGACVVRKNHETGGHEACLEVGGRQFFAWAAEPEDAVGFAVQDARSAINAMQGQLAELLG